VVSQKIFINFPLGTFQTIVGSLKTNYVQDHARNISDKFPFKKRYSGFRKIVFYTVHGPTLNFVL